MVGEKETYLDIRGYEGLYLVSNLGIIKRKYMDSERILKGYENKAGYLVVCLSKMVKLRILEYTV